MLWFDGKSISNYIHIGGSLLNIWGSGVFKLHVSIFLTLGSEKLWPGWPPTWAFLPAKRSLDLCMHESRMLRKNPWNQIKKISFPLHCKMHNDSPIGISRNFSFSTPHQKARHSSTFIQIRALSKFAFFYSLKLCCSMWFGVFPILSKIVCFFIKILKEK